MTTPLLDAYDEAYDDAYDDAYDEGYEEAKRPVRVARPQPTAVRPTDRPVTQAQLQSAINSVKNDTRTNSAAIQRVDGKVATLTTDVRRQTAVTRKEITDRKADTQALRQDLQQTRELAAILPVLTAPPGTATTSSLLLPLLLVGGMGSTSPSSGGTTTTSSGGLFGGGGDMTGLLLILALSGGLGGKA